MGAETHATGAVAPGHERRWARPLLAAAAAAHAVIRPLSAARFITAVVGTAIGLALRPSTWTPPVRTVLARQIYFTGVAAVPITCIAGLIVGVAVVAQAAMWLATIDQSALFGPLVAGVVVQVMAPLLVNFFVVGRSGTAITTELANMTVHHEVEVIDSQGIDPFVYLLVPRVVGMGVSVFCLTMLFAAVALLGGYAFGVILQVPGLSGEHLLSGVFLSIGPLDMILFVGKTLLPGMVTGAVCCVYGLRVEPVLTGVPQAATRAAVTSTWALFILVGLKDLIVML
jgi:phospholipid/cholesterol/gamma-HCH transport system permease protein